MGQGLRELDICLWKRGTSERKISKFKGLWTENFQIWGLVSWKFPNLGACELKFGWKLRLYRLKFPNFFKRRSCELTLLLEMGPLRAAGEAWKGGLQGHTSPYQISRSVPPPGLLAPVYWYLFLKTPPYVPKFNHLNDIRHYERKCCIIVRDFFTTGAASIFWYFSKTPYFWRQKYGFFFKKPKISTSLFWGFSKTRYFCCRNLGIFTRVKILGYFTRNYRADCDFIRRAKYSWSSIFGRCFMRMSQVC